MKTSDKHEARYSPLLSSSKPADLRSPGLTTDSTGAMPKAPLQRSRQRDLQIRIPLHASAPVPLHSPSHDGRITPLTSEDLPPALAPPGVLGSSMQSTKDTPARLRTTAVKRSTAVIPLPRIDAPKVPRHTVSDRWGRSCPAWVL
jgi:hypothetical protein